MYFCSMCAAVRRTVIARPYGCLMCAAPNAGAAVGDIFKSGCSRESKAPGRGFLMPILRTPSKAAGKHYLYTNKSSGRLSGPAFMMHGPSDIAPLEAATKRNYLLQEICGLPWLLARTGAPGWFEAATSAAHLP